MIKMDLLTILFIALGLSMDAVAVASGCAAGKAEVLGGLILIAIGLKILFDHLRAG